MAGVSPYRKHVTYRSQSNYEGGSAAGVIRGVEIMRGSFGLPRQGPMRPLRPVTTIRLRPQNV